MPTSVLDSGMVQILRPLARILLRQGITAHQFSRWAGAAFVQAATDLLVEQGSPISYSRISSMTGLHRHAVRDLQADMLKREPDQSDDKEYRRNRLARVLTGWFEDPGFTDRNGRPLPLPFDGPSPSFVELVRAYSGDIYPKIILEELTRVGAVTTATDESIHAKSRRYTLGGADSSSMRHATGVAADVLETLEHNTVAPAKERNFEDASISVELDAQYVPLMRRMLERRGAAFLDDIDGWLREKEGLQSAGPALKPKVRAGVRVVMVVDTAGSDDDGPNTGPADHRRSGV